MRYAFVDDKKTNKPPHTHTHTKKDSDDDEDESEEEDDEIYVEEAVDLGALDRFQAGI